MKVLLNILCILALSNICVAHTHEVGPEKPVVTTELVKIRVELSEMKFTVDGAKSGEPLVLKAGQRYKLVFENVGQTMHEVLLGRGLTQINGENEYEENLLANLSVIVTGSSIINGEKRIFEVVSTGVEELELDPGLRLSLLFTVPAAARGAWELGCFAPGHHESGMFLPVTVQ